MIYPHLRRWAGTQIHLESFRHFAEIVQKAKQVRSGPPTERGSPCLSRVCNGRRMRRKRLPVEEISARQGMSIDFMLGRHHPFLKRKQQQ
jgi:hypothetical protein